MIKPTYIFTLLMIFSSASFAGSREPLILRHLELIGTKAYLDNMEITFSRAMNEQLTLLQEEIFSEYDNDINSEIKLIRGKYTQQISEIAAKYYSWKSFKDDLVIIYSESFTDDELIALNNFFDSYIGKKYLEQSDFIDRRFSEVRKRINSEMKPVIHTLMDNMENELKSALMQHIENKQ